MEIQFGLPSGMGTYTRAMVVLYSVSEPGFKFIHGKHSDRQPCFPRKSILVVAPGRVLMDLRYGTVQ